LFLNNKLGKWVIIFDYIFIQRYTKIFYTYNKMYYIMLRFYGSPHCSYLSKDVEKHFKPTLSAKKYPLVWQNINSMWQPLFYSLIMWLPTVHISQPLDGPADLISNAAHGG